MTLIDQTARDGILDSEASIAISASAGSGKTTIMIRKIKKTLDTIDNHKTIAAITFTTKATLEIKKKAGNEGIKKDFVAMTNDSFIEREIIRPFISDVYGSDYKNDFTIDYNCKFNSFADGKASIVNQGKLGVFEEIKENFKFRLALDILKNNIAAQQYIQSKYEMVFLDEYQDSDLDMHNLFMYFKNDLNIKLFIVGDSKQAIYLWRGAQGNIFELLEQQDDIETYELITNFRSHDEIVNYANLIHNKHYFNENYSETVENVVLCKTSDFVQSFSQMIVSNEIDIQKEITIIININKEAKLCTKILNDSGYNFQFIPKTPIDDNTPNSSLLHHLACYVLDVNYTLYNFVEDTNLDSRKQAIIRLETIIETLKTGQELNESTIRTTLTKLSELMQIDVTDDEIDLFIETIRNVEFYGAFIKSEEKHKVMTVFGSKGLEFDQVISFSSYYKIHNYRDLQNHYVCITRAKSKFIMISNNVYDDFIMHNLDLTQMSNPNNLVKILN